MQGARSRLWLMLCVNQCGVRCYTPSLYIQTEPGAQQKRLMAGSVLPRFCIISINQSINQSFYLSCRWDSSGESIDNNWENNMH